ncbi:MAG TPA: polysaccharide biosynthesis/export family protein [Stellaceae bacterium]|nr:polysaccharide biosynthesis/export family protein [Stellaceae bacterium]
MRVLLLLAALLIPLVGCTPDAPNIAAARVVAGGSPIGGPHRLTPNDDIEVRFRFYADLNERVTVGPDGHITLQLIDDVPVAGLTVPEATKLLNQRYAKVLREPDVSITVRGYAPQEVYVDGWVTSPGLIRSDLPLTLSRAIAQAGGAKTGAHMDQILIIRRAGDGTFHYYEAALGNYGGVNHPDQDPVLSSYDLVYVPKTAIVSVADYVGTLTKNIPFYLNYPFNP